jgi:hypothetical protein
MTGLGKKRPSDELNAGKLARESVTYPHPLHMVYSSGFTAFGRGASQARGLEHKRGSRRLSGCSSRLSISRLKCATRSAFLTWSHILQFGEIPPVIFILIFRNPGN